MAQPFLSQESSEYFGHTPSSSLMSLETVCITGGAGFIGSHLADAFVGEGRRVLVIDDLSSGRRENLPKVADQPNYLPLRLCEMRSQGAHTEDLERAMQFVDRTAPIRYFLEAAIAARAANPSRLRAALELAQVTGEANFAMAVYVSQRMRSREMLDEHDKVLLRQMASELQGPHADVLRKRVQERLQ